jgi:Sec7-like guanine-nucleotide exchange factor
MKTIFCVYLQVKQTLNEFIKMNNGCNDGGDFPKELLTRIYNHIKDEPLRFPVKEQNTFSRISPDNGEKEGQ